MNQAYTTTFLSLFNNSQTDRFQYQLFALNGRRFKKAYWPMLGRKTAQLSLAFGVDDIEGTIDDRTKIYSIAGSEEQNPAMTTEEIVRLIKQVNRKPVERDTLYNVVEEY